MKHETGAIDVGGHEMPECRRTERGRSEMTGKQRRPQIVHDALDRGS